MGARPETMTHGWRLYGGPVKRECKFEVGQGNRNWRAEP